jgi:hypothetical protein
MNEYQLKCETLSKLYAEAAETGRKFEYLTYEGWSVATYGPHQQSDLTRWRLMSTKQSTRDYYIEQARRLIEKKKEPEFFRGNEPFVWIGEAGVVLEELVLLLEARK